MNNKNEELSLCEKPLLTLQEASLYTGLGVNKLREISDMKNCNFVLFVGNKRMLKRRLLEQFLDAAYSI